jgi:hypothetical protein
LLGYKNGFPISKKALLSRTSDFTNQEKKRAKEIRFLAGFIIFAIVTDVIVFFSEMQMLIIPSIDPFVALNNLALSRSANNLEKVINYLLLAFAFLSFLRLFIYTAFHKREAMKEYLGLKYGFRKYLLNTLLPVFLIYILNKWLGLSNCFGLFK